MARDDATRPDPAETFNSNLDLIARTVRCVAGRHFLSREDLKDFEAEVHLKLVDNDYAVLRQFRGQSRLSTYLTTVIQRAFLDYQIKRWGKWRPSAMARHLGSLAVALERLVHHEGRSFEEACAILDAAPRGPVHREQLAALLARLPVRPRRRMVELEGLQEPRSPDGADADLAAAERSEAARRAEQYLAEALAMLTPGDRLIVRLYFVDDVPISSIAVTLGLDQRRLYRSLERCLDGMRAHMEARGLAGPTVTALLGDPAVRIEVANLKSAALETPPPGPSHTAGAGPPAPDVKRGRE
jgi:RNA polymerase sigma factor (sigma-70 family)